MVTIACPHCKEPFDSNDASFVRSILLHKSCPNCQGPIKPDKKLASPVIAGLGFCLAVATVIVLDFVVWAFIIAMGLSLLSLVAASISTFFKLYKKNDWAIVPFNSAPQVKLIVKMLIGVFSLGFIAMAVVTLLYFSAIAADDENQIGSQVEQGGGGQSAEELTFDEVSNLPNNKKRFEIYMGMLRILEDENGGGSQAVVEYLKSLGPSQLNFTYKEWNHPGSISDRSLFTDWLARLGKYDDNIPIGKYLYESGVPFDFISRINQLRDYAKNMGYILTLGSSERFTRLALAVGFDANIYGSGNLLHLFAAEGVEMEALTWLREQAGEEWIQNHINKYDQFGLTPIHHAFYRSGLLIEDLVDAGADINAPLGEQAPYKSALAFLFNLDKKGSVDFLNLLGQEVALRKVTELASIGYDVERWVQALPADWAKLRPDWARVIRRYEEQ